jgi:predicted metal-dependent enzyme (double-stranded beta helix superfamily)
MQQPGHQELCILPRALDGSGRGANTAGMAHVLIASLDDAVALGDPAAIADRVKADLEHLIQTGGLALDDRFRRPRPDTYARRLLHRDPQARYTAVVMTWGPGQGTALHDHAGIWCVEGVVEGLMRVTRYDLRGETDGTYDFAEVQRVTAGVGSAGSLIPPFEYHRLENALPDGASITLHVYGGEMTSCHVFEPGLDGRYRRLTRTLAYHE